MNSGHHTPFNDWAKARTWESECDPTLTFEAPLLREALSAWRRLAGDAPIPTRRSLTPRALKPLIGQITIFERLEDSAGYRIRLMGTRITEVLGEMQGKTLDEALPPDAAMRWRTALDNTLGERCPLRFLSRVAFNNLDFLQAELLLAPLLDDAGALTMAFAVTIFHTGSVQESKLDKLLARA